MARKATIPEHDARLVPIESLKHYRNPRRGDVTVIRESLRENGQYRPLVVRRKTREVLAGNHTLKAAKEEGWSEVWATFIDCDARHAKRIALVDNRTNDLAGYDEQALVRLIGSLPSLAGTGWSREAYDELIARAQPPQRPPDVAPEPPEEPETRPGDLSVLGEHRLLCGSSTDAAHVTRLLADEAVDLIVTDPPYGVDYLGGVGADARPDDTYWSNRRKDGKVSQTTR
jgi:ParB-like nuclease family protein